MFDHLRHTYIADTLLLSAIVGMLGTKLHGIPPAPHPQSLLQPLCLLILLRITRPSLVWYARHMNLCFHCGCSSFLRLLALLKYNADISFHAFPFFLSLLFSAFKPAFIRFSAPRACSAIPTPPAVWLWHKCILHVRTNLHTLQPYSLLLG